MSWGVFHEDGSLCFKAVDEDTARATVHYFDSNAATGRPMECSPHTARVLREQATSVADEGETR